MSVPLDLAPKNETGDPILQVFRLRTTAFHCRKNGLIVTKSLRRLRRQSTGHHWFEEDVSNFGEAEVAGRIQNLYTVPDGVYTIEICNASYEYVEGYRTGYLDDYDYSLKPYPIPCPPVQPLP